MPAAAASKVCASEPPPMPFDNNFAAYTSAGSMPQEGMYDKITAGSQSSAHVPEAYSDILSGMASSSAMAFETASYEQGPSACEAMKEETQVNGGQG